jgi:hypothetical protein
MDDPMRARLLSVLLAALIAGVAVYTPSAEGQPEPDQIDFAELHGQAAAALQMLQTSQERNLAPQQAAAATF